MATAFAEFREAVFDDFHLQMRLRSNLGLNVYVTRDLYLADVVAVGAERGFTFDVDMVLSVLRDGADAWLLQGVDFR